VIVLQTVDAPRREMTVASAPIPPYTAVHNSLRSIGTDVPRALAAKPA
jgi:hypothetical protein